MSAADWTEVIDDRPGRFRVRRDIFTDPRFYDLEIAHLFEGGWVYIGHASQLPRPHDFLASWIGRRPIVIMRGSDGVVRAFHNACPHKGAMICSHDRGNARLHICPYHSWSFSSSGELRGVKARDEGGYTAEFLDARHDLVPIARFDQYRGFYFGSLKSDVPDLADYLGEVRPLLDLAIDQSVDGLEFVPGRSVFTYEGNWKYQLENCSDGYHVTSVHPTYLDVARSRAESSRSDALGGIWDRTSAALEDRAGDAQFGTFQFDHGHVAIWSASSPDPGHPLFSRLDELVARVGETRARWMFYTRNITIFPNLQIADNFSSQVRVMRPLGPHRTEMSTYCVGPRGEDPAARAQRLRQYEDFFMPSGMATPDDLVLYEDCHQSGVGARDTWQSYDRGMAVRVEGSNPEARELDMRTAYSVRGPGQLWDETAMQGYYRAWRERIPQCDAYASAS